MPRTARTAFRWPTSARRSTPTKGRGTLTSFTVGIGLNRIADFNSRYSYKTDTPYAGGSVWAPTIADIFGQQLGQAGIFPNGNDELGYNVNPYYWPAVLGYNGFMISRHFYTDPETQEEKPTYVPLTASVATRRSSITWTSSIRVRSTSSPSRRAPI